MAAYPSVHCLLAHHSAAARLSDELLKLACCLAHTDGSPFALCLYSPLCAAVYHHSHPHISDRLGKIDEALKKGQ